MSGLCTLSPTQGPGVDESLFESSDDEGSPLSLSLYTCPKEAAAIGLGEKSIIIQSSIDYQSSK